MTLAAIALDDIETTGTPGINIQVDDLDPDDYGPDGTDLADTGVTDTDELAALTAAGLLAPGHTLADATDLGAILTLAANEATRILNGAADWMKAHRGPIEQPPGSNRVAAVWPVVRPSFQGQPWCAGAVTAAYLSMGVDLRKIRSDGNSFYCPYIEAWAKRNGVWRSRASGYMPTRGDLALYGISRASHIGISAPGPDPYLWAWEGNTSPGNGGSQADGGGLYYRGRSRSWIRGWVDMRAALQILDVTRPEAPAKHEPTWKALAKALRAKPAWGPWPLKDTETLGRRTDVPGVLDGRDKRSRAAVRLCQAYFDLNPAAPFGPSLEAHTLMRQKADGVAQTGRIDAAMWYKIRPEGESK